MKRPPDHWDQSGIEEHASRAAAVGASFGPSASTVLVVDRPQGLH